MTEIVPNNSQVVKQPDDASSNLQSQSLHSPSSSTMTASMSQSATTATSNTNAVSASQAKAFSNSFWGEGNKGLEILLARMKQAKLQTMEIHDMLKERASMEEDYGKRLVKLVKTFNTGYDANGTLHDSLDVVRHQLERSARSHLDLANEIRLKLEKPLQEFINTQNTLRKNHKKILEKHVSNLQSQEASVLKSKDRYEVKSAEISQINAFLRQGNVNTREAEKLKTKMDKAQTQVRQFDSEYRMGIDKLGDLHRTWQIDMVTACNDYQKMEEDRFQFIRGSLWNYSNFVSAFCVSEDESSELIRLSLEKCDFEKDLDDFLDKNATGSTIPKPLSYVPYSENATNQTANAYTVVGGVGAAPGNNAPKTSAIGAAASFFFGASNKTPVLTPTQPASTQQQQTAPIIMQNSENKFLSEALGRQQSQAKELGEGSTSDGNARSSNAENLQNMPLRKSFEALAMSESSLAPYDPYDVQENTSIKFTVRALYDYESTAPEEINLLKGQIIPVTEAHEDGWWEGIVIENGRRRKGLFPSNFTEKN